MAEPEECQFISPTYIRLWELRGRSKLVYIVFKHDKYVQDYKLGPLQTARSSQGAPNQSKVNDKQMVTSPSKSWLQATELSM